ncbi:MAG TPA: hypothetical protein VK922_05395, partial [Gemmatimonadaceae bacterium]|nr:hypothetical protein [Gemmatimonadaceae bacterium]
YSGAMRIELLPVLLGILAVVMGGALVLDAVIKDGTFIPVERRRSQRPPRSQLGEGLLGGAIIFLGASLIGGDQWPYTTLSVVLAVVLGAAGVILNWRYLSEMAIAPKRRSDADEPSDAIGPDSEVPTAGPRLHAPDGERPATLR